MANGLSIGQVLAGLKSVESGGNYQALGPLVTKGMYKGEQALGAYQVMPGNLPEWSKKFLGYEVSPSEFLASPDLQDQLATGVLMQNYNKYGNWSDPISIWHSGRPLSQAQGATDGYMRTTDYTSEVMKRAGNSSSMVDPDDEMYSSPYDQAVANNPEGGPLKVTVRPQEAYGQGTGGSQGGDAAGDPNSAGEAAGSGQAGQSTDKPSDLADKGTQGSAGSIPQAIVTAGNQVATATASGSKAEAEAATQAAKLETDTEKALQSQQQSWASNWAVRIFLFIVGAIFIAAGLFMFGKDIVPMGAIAKAIK